MVKIQAVTIAQIEAAEELQKEIPDGELRTLLVYDSGTSAVFINSDGNTSYVDIDGIHEAQELLEAIRPDTPSGE